MSSDTIKLIHDCDPGTDDSVSIMMALMHPRVQLLAVTAESGNLPSDRTSENALRVMEYLGVDDVPVAQGMLHPLVRPLPPDPYSHGTDGLGNHFFPKPSRRPVAAHAAQVIIDLVMANPGEVTIVCTAPLTNVALAMMLKPEIVPLIRQIYHIGGAYGFTEHAFRNATGDNPMSEWNVYVDPEAAKIVYESGANLTTIGLDVAFNPEWTNISEGALNALRKAGTQAATYALEIIEYIDGNNSIPDQNLFINGPIDTVAMCAAICPEILSLREIRVAVDTGSQLTRGMTLWDRRDHFRWDHLPVIKSATALDSIAYQEVFVEALSGAR